MVESDGLMQVEEIIDTCILEGGKRLYHVKWKSIWIAEDQLPTKISENTESEKHTNDGVYVFLDERKNETGIVEYLLSYSSTWEREEKLIDSCPELLSSFWSFTSVGRVVQKVEETDEQDSYTSYTQELKIKEGKVIVEDGSYPTPQYGKSDSGKEDVHGQPDQSFESSKDRDNEYRPLFSSLSDMHDHDHLYDENPSRDEKHIEIVAVLPTEQAVTGAESVDEFRTHIKKLSYDPNNLNGFQIHSLKTAKGKVSTKKRLCDRCGKYFSTKSNLNRHRKKCVGGRQFYCEICGENFSKSFSLILHQRNHTKHWQQKAKSAKVCNDGVNSDDGTVSLQVDNVTSQNNNLMPYNKNVSSLILEANSHNDTIPDLTSQNNIVYHNNSQIISHNNNLSALNNNLISQNDIVNTDSSGNCQDDHINSQNNNSNEVSDNYLGKPWKGDQDDKESYQNDKVLPWDDKQRFRSDTDTDTDKGKVNSWSSTNCKQFASGYTLKEYQKVPTVLTPDRKYKCDKCWKQFSTKSNLNRHYKACNVGKLFTCKVCGVSFAKSFNMKVHERLHVNEMFYQCQICSQYFSSRLALNEHLKIHRDKQFANTVHNDVENKQPVTQEYEAAKHYQDISHVDAERKQCRTQEYKSISISDKDYRSIVHNDTQLPMTAVMKECRRERIESGRYHCKTCGMKFSTKSNLNRHAKNCSGGKLFSCNICHVSFVKNINLKIHQRLHSNDNRFRCNVCNKQCLTSYALLEHERVHTGVRPFKCNNCGRQFTTKSNWKRHQLMHICKRVENSEPQTIEKKEESQDTEKDNETLDVDTTALSSNMAVVQLTNVAGDGLVESNPDSEEVQHVNVKEATLDVVQQNCLSNQEKCDSHDLNDDFKGKNHTQNNSSVLLKNQYMFHVYKKSNIC